MFFYIPFIYFRHLHFLLSCFLLPGEGVSVAILAQGLLAQVSLRTQRARAYCVRPAFAIPASPKWHHRRRRHRAAARRVLQRPKALPLSRLRHCIELLRAHHGSEPSKAARRELALRMPAAPGEWTCGNRKCRNSTNGWKWNSTNSSCECGWTRNKEDRPNAAARDAKKAERAASRGPTARASSKDHRAKSKDRRPRKSQ